MTVTPFLSLFTFHYASIKTECIEFLKKYHLQFTFHYASIKTYIRELWQDEFSEFTFHYASIKTCFISIDTLFRP